MSRRSRRHLRQSPAVTGRGSTHVDTAFMGLTSSGGVAVHCKLQARASPRPIISQSRDHDSERAHAVAGRVRRGGPAGPGHGTGTGTGDGLLLASTRRTGSRKALRAGTGGARRARAAARGPRAGRPAVPRGYLHRGPEIGDRGPLRRPRSTDPDPRHPRPTRVTPSWATWRRRQRRPPRPSKPLVGRIAAGTPITAERHVDDVYTFPRQVEGSGEPFVLTVVGDSKAGDGHILDGGDTVVRSESAPLGRVFQVDVDRDGLAPPVGAGRPCDRRVPASSWASTWSRPPRTHPPRRRWRSAARPGRARSSSSTRSRSGRTRPRSGSLVADPARHVGRSRRAGEPVCTRLISIRHGVRNSVARERCG